MRLSDPRSANRHHDRAIVSLTDPLTDNSMERHATAVDVAYRDLMRATPPLDPGRYASARIADLPHADVGWFTFTALVASFYRIVNAHGDCELDGCPQCHEMSIALEIIDALTARLGPAPDGMPVPRQRAKRPASP
jgi:hypothetical protein